MDDASANSPPNRGRLAQLHPNYGFVDTGGLRLFFHRGEWTGKLDFGNLGEGAIVEFEIGSNEKGTCAVNVRPMGERGLRLEEGLVVLGSIKTLENTYGLACTQFG